MAEHRRLHRSRRALSLVVVLLFAALAVATSPPLSYVRGDVSVHERDGHPASGAHVFVLLPTRPGHGELPVFQLRTDADGSGSWPILWESTRANTEGDLDQPLIVAWSPGHGADVERLDLDADFEHIERYRVLLLGHDYWLARSRFVLTTVGHAPALRIGGDEVMLPAAPYERWVVFASYGGPPEVRKVGASTNEQRLALPPHFNGEVFAVWGGNRLAPRLTTPVAVAEPREGAR